jgi:quercetin dioxygenase-like cupin family protein
MRSLLLGLPGKQHRTPLIGLTAIVMVLSLALVAGFYSGKPVHAADGKLDITILSRGPFTDEARGLLTLRLQGEQFTTPMVLPNVGEVVTLKVVLEQGEAFPWHIHPGPVIVTVAQGEVTVTQASDCSERTYTVGQSFLEATNRIHKAVNSGDQDLVLYGTFLGIPTDSPPTIPTQKQDFCGG